MTAKMDAIILAGGLGTRLRAEVPGLPKPLAPVNGRPFLDILFGQLAGSGLVRRVVLAAGYRAADIAAAYGPENFGLETAVSVEKEPLGTGGAVKLALPLTSGPEVLVMNGDSYAELDLAAFAAFHAERAAAFTLALRRVPDAGRYGRVAAGPGGAVESFEEKRPGAGEGLVNAGVYLASRAALDALPEGRSSLERDLLPGLCGRGLYGFETGGKFIDIGLPETYRAADDYLKGTI